MLFFGISALVAFSLIFAFLIPIAMIAMIVWVYRDAKIHTDNPWLWTLIVIVVPNFIGLIIYLLVGRNRRESTWF